MSDDNTPTCSVKMTGIPQEVATVRDAYLELGWTETGDTERDGVVVGSNLIHAQIPGTRISITAEHND